MLKELSSICARQALCWATPHPSNSFETLSGQTKSTWSLVPDCLFWDSGFKGKRQCVAEQRQQTSQKARRQRTSGSSWETMFGGPTKLSTITAVHKGKEQSQESRKHMGPEEQETKYLWTRRFWTRRFWNLELPWLMAVSFKHKRTLLYLNKCTRLFSSGGI